MDAPNNLWFLALGEANPAYLPDGLNITDEQKAQAVHHRLNQVALEQLSQGWHLCDRCVVHLAFWLARGKSSSVSSSVLQCYRDFLAVFAASALCQAESSILCMLARAVPRDAGQSKHTWLLPGDSDFFICSWRGDNTTQFSR